MLVRRSSASRRAAAAAAPHDRLRARAARALLGTASRCGSARRVVMSLQPGCSCHKNRPASCETATDCARQCPKGQLPFCIDNTCVCSDDIPTGPHRTVLERRGRPRDGSIWVSAYAQTYGDLVVAQAPAAASPTESWEWVDGVPDGPVVVPGSKIRGGISDDGPDVGMYTSIQVDARRHADGDVLRSSTNASLKFAAQRRRHVAGPRRRCRHRLASTTPAARALVGMYTSLTLRGDDGRPGVAYLAHVTDASGEHAEVRFAPAQIAVPTSASDWQSWTSSTPRRCRRPIRTTRTSTRCPRASACSSTRRAIRANQAPVVAYYDRAAGELKLSQLRRRARASSARRSCSTARSGVDDGWIAVGRRSTRSGVAHVAYVDATSDELLYIVDAGATRRGGRRRLPRRRPDRRRPARSRSTTSSATTRASCCRRASARWSSYQDATTQELLLAQRQMNGMWTHMSIAGATDPWPGAYGFFASVALDAERHRAVDVGDRPADRATTGSRSSRSSC